jgi:hypothetical protein
MLPAALAGGIVDDLLHLASLAMHGIFEMPGARRSGSVHVMYT